MNDTFKERFTDSVLPSSLNCPDAEGLRKLCKPTTLKTSVWGMFSMWLVTMTRAKHVKLKTLQKPPHKTILVLVHFVRISNACLVLEGIPVSPQPGWNYPPRPSCPDEARKATFSPACHNSWSGPRHLTKPNQG